MKFWDDPLSSPTIVFFTEKNFTIKVNVRKQRLLTVLTVFKLKSKNFCMRLNGYTIDYKNANEILTETLNKLYI